MGDEIIAGLSNEDKQALEKRLSDVERQLKQLHDSIREMEREFSFSSCCSVMIGCVYYRMSLRHGGYAVLGNHSGRQAKIDHENLLR